MLGSSQPWESGLPFTALLCLPLIPPPSPHPLTHPSFQVVISPPSFGSITSQTDLRNGSYSASVLLNSLGAVTLTLQIRGEPVVQPPLFITVLPPLCDATSMVLDASRTTCLCRASFGLNTSVVAPSAAGIVCSLCPEGAFSPSNSQSSCLTCPTGFYSHAGATGCTQCPAVGVTCDNGILTYLNGYW